MAKTELKNVAYEYISNAILSYEFVPGQVIVEQDLSDLLGISRTPVREALKQLQLEGLVRHIPSRGTFVEDITVHDVEEIFQIRILLETAALQMAIVDVTDAELDAIGALLKRLDDKRINERNAKEQFFNSDRDLHHMIMKYSRNARMIAIHKNIEVQQERLRRISSMTPMRLTKSRQEHMQLLDAMRARDLARATEALTTHMNNVKESTLNVCQNVRLGIIQPG